MSADWFVLVEGKETGPFSAPQLKQLAERGAITPTTSVRQARMPHPAPAAEVPGLFSIAISKRDPNASQLPPPEDSDPFVFWGLTAFAGIAIVIVGYFGWNWLSSEKTGDKVAAEESTSGEGSSASSGPRPKVSDWPDIEPEEPSWEQDAEAAAKEQEFLEREAAFRERVQRLRASEAKAKTDLEKAQGTAEQEEARQAALEAQQRQQQQLIQAQTAFAKDYGFYWDRMQRLANTRENKLLQPFYKILSDAKEIVTEHEGRAREHKITQLKDRIKALEKLRERQENDYYTLGGELKRRVDASSQLARSDRGYAPLADSWKTMHKAHEEAEDMYSELKKALEQCLNSDPEKPRVIDYRKLLRAREQCESEMKKLRSTIAALDQPAKLPSP